MTASESAPSPSWRSSFRRRLLGWYRQNARDLPWRRQPEAYRVWISEIMLQQTQVATVVPYFERFVARFPDVTSLAAADEQEVLRLWEGLGYYRRARQLHQAARQIVERHQGQFPQSFEETLALPGIGRYTAGAILSIAFDASHPILEANTHRLLCRLLAYRSDPASAAGQRVLWSFAERLLPAREAGVFNQALMELGSLVCTPRNPSCDVCPAKMLCPTFAAGLQSEIPAPKRKPVVEQSHQAAVVIHRQGKILLRQCQQDERWAGLWDFPRFVVSMSDTSGLADEIVARTRDLTGLKVTLGEQFTTLRHGVTRFRITLRGYEAAPARGARVGRNLPVQWVGWRQLGEFPLNVTGRKLARLASLRQG